MTTFQEVEVSCAVCESRHKHTRLLSTSSFGPPDLDTRPAPPARLSLALQVQCCPVCGYCAWDITKAPPEAKRVVCRQDYQALLRDSRFPYLARMFLCLARIQEAAGNLSDAGWAALYAAWACDDAGLGFTSAAARCRERAIALFVKARAKGQPFLPESGAEEALLADLYRRIGQFDEAEKEIQRGLEKVSSDLLRRLLAFQRRLCRARDTEVHRMDEVPEVIPEDDV